MEIKDIPIVKIGETFCGFVVTEDNRATVWEHTHKEVEELEQYCVRNYTSKGIDAVLVGVRKDYGIEYAVFTTAGFLRDTATDI